MEKKSITSFLSINSHIFPRLSFMTGGGNKKFQCTCPTDGQRDTQGKICDCTENTAEQTSTTNQNPTLRRDAASSASSDTTTTTQNPNQQSTTPITTTNKNPNTTLDLSGNDNYDTYTEPQTESEA